MTLPEPTMEERGRWAAQNAVRQVARELAGPGADIGMLRAVPGLVTRFWDVAPEWGLRGALVVWDAAVHAVGEYASWARGQGSGWEVLAEPLGLVAEAAEQEMDSGEAAFRFVVYGLRPGQDLSAQQRRDQEYYLPAARWTCVSCGRLVTDTGPWQADPPGGEAGHAPDCARHRGTGATGTDERGGGR